VYIYEVGIRFRQLFVAVRKNTSRLKHGFTAVAELVVYQQLCRVISELHLTYRGGLTEQTPAITDEF